MEPPRFSVTAHDYSVIITYLPAILASNIFRIYRLLYNLGTAKVFKVSLVVY